MSQRRRQTWLTRNIEGSISDSSEGINMETGRSWPDLSSLERVLVQNRLPSTFYLLVNFSFFFFLNDLQDLIYVIKNKINVILSTISY